MRNRRIVLQALVSVALVVGLMLPALAVGATTAVHRPDDRSQNHLVTDSWSNTPAFALTAPQGQVTPMVAAGLDHTVGLKPDGTVVAVGDGSWGQCDVEDWTGIVQVSAGWAYTVGLKSDGTVAAVGSNFRGKCNVGDWTGIVQVAAGWDHTVGLKSDGTVVAVGYNAYGQCNVGDWTGIVQVAAGWGHTVGLKSDGTVVAVGYNWGGQRNVGDWTGIVQVAAGWDHTVGLKSDGTLLAVGDDFGGKCDLGEWKGIVQVTAGGDHTVGLKADGTVVAVGSNTAGQCNVGSWQGTMQVAAGYRHTVGLKSDGTIVAVGDGFEGQCNVRDWTGIMQVAAGRYHTVGLKPGGTVVAVGYDQSGQCNVGSLTGIVQVSAGGAHTVGLKSDGTVVAVGDSRDGQCNVGDWTGIVQVAAGWGHTVGLKSDGTVVAVGDNRDGQCNVGDWTGIVQVAAGWGHTVGLKSDGTVVAAGHGYNVGEWTGIVQMAAGWGHTVGLKSDGTVVAVGYDYYGQCNVGDWTGIVQVEAGGDHTVGLKADGTVVAVGDNRDGQCNAGDWTGIMQVEAGGAHTVGLKADGSAVAVGDNRGGQCNVGDWTVIVQVVAGGGHTVGLRSDGMVVAAGKTEAGQSNVGGWTGIVQVAAGGGHTAGLKPDGTVVAAGHEYNVGEWTGIVQVAAGGGHTVGLESDGMVVAVGSNHYGQSNVGGWTGIVQVAAGGGHTVGLKPDGTVVAVGDSFWGQCNVEDWAAIVQVAAGGGHTVGLKPDGMVVDVGDNRDGQCNVGDWTGVVQVAAGGAHTVGLKSDGTVVAVGDNFRGQCNVGDWTDIVQVAAGYGHTVGLRSDGTVVAAGLEVELAKWNLGETIPPELSKFAIGDWVRTTGNLNVREGPGLGYDVIKTMPLGATGQILAGPIAADGFFWWELEYAVGVRGWSVENWLELHETGAPICIVKLQMDGAEIHEVGIWEFFDICMGHSISDTGITQVRFSSDHVRDGYPTGRWTDWFDWSASSEDWDATTKTKRWAFDTPGYKEVWAQVKDESGRTAFGLATILVPAPALPVLTSPLSITPVKDIYNVGDSLEAEFTIVNIGDVPITLDVLTVGGRLNGFIPPGGAPDFTFRSVTLLPNVPYEYQGSLTLEQTGQYRFFVAFHIESPTQDEQRLLDENNWNTCIEIGDGLLHTDRVRSVIVYEEDTVPDDVAQLSNLIAKLKSISTHIPPYLLDDESFGGSVATLWMYWKSFVTDSWEAYDMHYFAGLDYNYLRVKTLVLAGDTLDLGNLEQARRLVQMSIDYGKLSSASFQGAFLVYDRNVEQAQAVARFVKDRCQAVVVAGVSAWNPAAGKVLDYAFLCTDYLINRQLLGEEEAKKIAIRDGVVKTVFTFAPIFDGKTLSDYVKAHPSFQLTQLRHYIVNSDTLPDILYDVIRNWMVDEAFEVVKELAIMISDMLSSAIEYEVLQTLSPVELRVRDSQGRVTGLIGGEVKHEVPGSMYNDGGVTILFPLDIYCYEIVGTDAGAYGLNIARVEGGSVTGFAGTAMPTSVGALDKYTINWEALTQGEPGITIEKDHDGDGEIDETVITGIPQTPTDPSPANNATDVSLNTTLSWSGDSSEEDIAYDVYFGTDMDPPLVSERQSETTYLPVLQPYTRYYWRVAAINEHSISSTGSAWNFITQGAGIVGEVRDVRCDILYGVNITLYHHGEVMPTAFSDVGGSYVVRVLDPGEYELVASKDGFRDVRQWIDVTELGHEYELHFRADHGLIPNAPDMSYVLSCINLWQFGELPCKLAMSRVLAVINAWQFPIVDA